MRSPATLALFLAVGGPAVADPAADFESLEARLSTASVVRLDFRATAEGVVEADLSGRLEIGPMGHAQLIATGHFAGEAVELRLAVANGRLTLDNGASKTEATRPAHLEEALVIGLTRMGILHNLANLSGGAPPDHADGGVREWVVVEGLAEGGVAASVSFDLVVAGEPAGSAELMLDARGRPSLRRQTVEFPSGQMRVVERYSAVTIEP